MTNAVTVAQINPEQIHDVLAEVQEAFFDIPFENSQFQTENFVIGAAQTPERAYRAIGLQMMSKITAIKEAKHQRALDDLEVEELQMDMEDFKENLSHYGECTRERRRCEIGIERLSLKISQKLSGRDYTDKLLNDALVELNCLYKHFKSLPKFTREEFEAGERPHFQARLERQIAGRQGAVEALDNMVGDLNAICDYEQQYLALLK